MKTNIETSFYNYIKESIYALGNDTNTIVEFYGDKDKCTIENYFGAQINSGILYNSTEEFSEETKIGMISDFEYEFNEAREKAYSEWLAEKCESIDESVLVNVASDVEHTENGVELYGESSDMTDYEMHTEGDSLFLKIYDHMAECSFGQNVKVAAILAGAKYICRDDSYDEYMLHFWKKNKAVDLLGK